MAELFYGMAEKHVDFRRESLSELRSTAKWFATSSVALIGLLSGEVDKGASTYAWVAVGGSVLVVVGCAVFAIWPRSWSTLENLDATDEWLDDPAIGILGAHTAHARSLKNGLKVDSATLDGIGVAIAVASIALGLETITLVALLIMG